MNKLIIFHNNKKAPKPNKPLTPGVCAVILNKNNEVFLHKRSDLKNLWALPGGTMKVGESVAKCCKRELYEETKLKVSPEKLIGLYTSPNCIFKWSDNLIYQSFVIAFLCKSKSSKIILNAESDTYGWFKKNDLQKLETVPYVKKIVQDAFSKKKSSFYD